jgi:hypothetical protein
MRPFLCNVGERPEEICELYDLYACVHHVGDLQKVREVMTN